MIALFTDFGTEGPYLGQMRAVLQTRAPGIPVIDLMHDVPAHDPRAGAYLLAALAPEFPFGSVFVCVVDPRVGSERKPIAVRANSRWYVGPDNGLLNVIEKRAAEVEWYDVTWEPDRLSSTFHGRDLFAPVAAIIARGEEPPGRMTEPRLADWPDDLEEIIYIDRFGNAISGTRAAGVDPAADIGIGGQRLARARIFADVPVGQGFWYENSNGLVEIAVNQGRADEVLGLSIGMPLTIG
jgi:hypothetical protein